MNWLNSIREETVREHPTARQQKGKVDQKQGRKTQHNGCFWLQPDGFCMKCCCELTTGRGRWRQLPRTQVNLLAFLGSSSAPLPVRTMSKVSLSSSSSLTLLHCHAYSTVCDPAVPHASCTTGIEESTAQGPPQQINTFVASTTRGQKSANAAVQGHSYEEEPQGEARNSGSVVSNWTQRGVWASARLGTEMMLWPERSTPSHRGVITWGLQPAERQSGLTAGLHSPLSSSHLSDSHTDGLETHIHAQDAKARPAFVQTDILLFISPPPRPARPSLLVFLSFSWLPRT